MSALPAPSHDDTSMRDERVVCDHSAQCAGCPLIDRTYGEQLAVKRARVVHSLSPYAWNAAPLTQPVAPADPLFGYRTRAKLVVAPGAKLGLFARGGGHRVVDIPRCRVLAPALARVAAIVRTHIAAAEANGGPLSPYDPAGGGCLRAVDLREVLDRAAASVLVTFVVQRDRVSSAAALEPAARALLEASPDVTGVACNFHEGDAPQILGGETLALAGRTSAPDRIGSSVHFATFGSFVQAHRGQAAHVHALVAEAFGLSGEGDARQGRRPRVLDLYGGSGSIALGLASRGASVRLVESFAPAAAQARAAALAQGAAVDVQCDDVAGAARTIARAGERFDAAVVNPPRRGMSPPAREWLARLGPSVIAYVSCNPDTLVRDLDHFARLGYAANELRPVDMMPLTEEVETVAVLRRCAVPLPRAVYQDDEIVVVDKGPHEPTLAHGEYRESLLARVRRMAGMESAAAVHRLDIGTSGLVIFSRRPENASKWGRALSGASTRTVYVAAVRGVTLAKGAIARDLHDEGRAYAARTRYRKLAVTGGHSVLRVVPEQGRTHQVRRHLAAIGHPVLGDDRYGHAATNRFFEEKHGLDRTFLHCVRLEIEHPDTGAPYIFEARLPGDLRAVLERLSGPGTLRSLDENRALGPRSPQ